MRKLTADEIEVRVGTVSKNGSGCSLLLYKDARVDMKLLTETYGVMGWKRSHRQIGDNLFCTISVWDSEKGEWIDKEDVGTESFTEPDKGRCSDSFKRAGTNWGIGVELYTSPFIWVTNVRIEDKKVKDSFKVKEIGYDEKDNISRLVIVNQKNDVVFSFGGKTTKPKNETKKKESKEELRIPKYIPNEESKMLKATEEQIKQINDIIKSEIPEDKVPLFTMFVTGAYKKDRLDALSQVQAYSVISSFDLFKERFETGK